MNGQREVFDLGRLLTGCGQREVKLLECATCNREIWPPNSVRGYGNYKQYCSCVRIQVPKVKA